MATRREWAGPEADITIKPIASSSNDKLSCWEEDIPFQKKNEKEKQRKGKRKRKKEKKRKWGLPAMTFLAVNTFLRVPLISFPSGYS